MRNDPLIPMLVEVTDIRTDTPDVKTFRVVDLNGKKPFEHIPGQCAMLSMPGVGEALFSITSSPTEERFLEFSIKKCGCVTSWLHGMEPGQQLTVDQLRDHAAGSLARYKVPTSVHFLPSLPHSLTGKVSRARLRELGLTGAAADEDTDDE